MINKIEINNVIKSNVIIIVKFKRLQYNIANKK